MGKIADEIRPFFEPRSIAVVGASTNPAKPGYNVFYNLAENKRKGLLEAELYPVNPRAREVMGFECYPSLKEVPGPVELVVVVVPAKLVPRVMEEAGLKEARAAIIISSGFSEVGNKELEEEVVRVGREFGIRILGPNCVGVFDPYTGVDTVFLPLRKSLPTGEEMESAPKPPRGRISMITQSGAFGVASLDYMAGHGMGISRFVSLGNKCDLDETDFLEFLGEDGRTDVILLYVEDIRDGRRFMEVARRTTPHKPVVVLKAGWSSAGSRAVMSHTGAMAGSDEVYEAAFRQCGVLRARTMEEFFSMGKALSMQPPARGPRVAIITNAGGPGVMTVDACEARGLVVPELPGDTKARLEALVREGKLPEFASIGNPIDLTVSVTDEMFKLATEVIIEDPNIDGVIILGLHHPPGLRGDYVEAIAELARRSDKPVVACDIGGADMAFHVRKLFDEKGIPAFESPEGAAAAMWALYACGLIRARATGSGPQDLKSL